MTDDMHAAKLKTFHHMIWQAKRSFFEDLLMAPDVQLWEVAKWQKGHQDTVIGPLSDGLGLMADPEAMATLLGDHFFRHHTLCICSLSYSHPPLPPCPFADVMGLEILAALEMCSHMSALGLSSVSYTVIQ
jgi:hypothetical protein